MQKVESVWEIMTAVWWSKSIKSCNKVVHLLVDNSG